MRVVSTTLIRFWKEESLMSKREIGIPNEIVESGMATEDDAQKRLRQRQRLAELIGRLLARHWLRNRKEVSG